MSSLYKQGLLTDRGGDQVSDLHNLSLEGKNSRTILGIQDSGINLTLQMFKCQILGQDINELGSRVGGRPGSDQASLRGEEGGETCNCY